MRSIFISMMLCLAAGCGSAQLDQSELGAYGPGDRVGASGRESEIVQTPGAKGQPSAPPLAAPEAPSQVQLTQRQVIYSASLRMVVLSASEASSTIRTIAESMGGYLQESNNESITVRVPANQFQAAIDQISRQGEVVDRVVKASDVTEEMLDLNIRLENAKKSRERLLAILEKLEKLEETLKVEAELMRLTTTIETIEGKLRYMQSQIAMSTIRVELNSRTVNQSGGDPLGVPFAWVARLGDGLLAGTVESMPRKPRIFSAGPRFDPPAAFIRYYSDENLVEAMNADGIRIKVQRHENFDKGDLAFWKKLARRSLVETRALAIAQEEPVDGNAVIIVGSRDVAGGQYGYLLLLSRSDKYLHTFEAWGPESQFRELRKSLEQSARTMQR